MGIETGIVPDTGYDSNIRQPEREDNVLSASGKECYVIEQGGK